MITTCLTDHELNMDLGNDDQDLQYMLDQIRKESQRDWQIVFRDATKKRLFRKPIVTRYYQLFVNNPDGVLPYIQINFYAPNGGMSLGIRKESLANYLMGLLDGNAMAEDLITIVKVKR